MAVSKDSTRVLKYLEGNPRAVVTERIAAATGLSEARTRVVADALVSRGLLHAPAFDYYAAPKEASDG